METIPAKFIEEAKQIANDMDLSDYLQKKYPQLVHKCFDCSIREGWHPLILYLCDYLQGFSEKNPKIGIAQIKEKFAQLRVYLNGVPNEDYDSVYSVVNMLENLSLKYCENCGTTEQVTTDAKNRYWIKTFCDKCHNERP